MDPFSRLPRVRARQAALSALLALIGLGAFAVLLRPDPVQPPGWRPTQQAAAAPERPATAPLATRSQGSIPLAPVASRQSPRTLTAAFAHQGSTGELATCAGDPALPPHVRYAALRRLEETAPEQAVSAAIAALTDTTSLVRLNAIALLARSQDPRAREALGRIDPRSQRLAQALTTARR